MIWVADTVQASGNFFTVKADTWFDARRVAMMRFGAGPDEVVLEEVTEHCGQVNCPCSRNHVVADVELTWTGSDYASHGGRVMLWRRGSEKEWKPLETFR